MTRFDFLSLFIDDLQVDTGTSPPTRHGLALAVFVVP
jgi:hypothetical protein